ncbi:hypothetical protein ACNJX9_39060 [Bradyrhizobium sp. DASA03076]|uniref:hypothetical protein n=1 Tax=Bradyrhizobium sp. BLXBL-03 TaxID=3395916 RepID=UPI003F71FA7C
MGDDILLVRPGKVDINGQFTAGAKIRRTRRLYDRIKDASGKYNFGELTAFFYGYDEDQDAAWQDDIRNNYPPNVIDKIRDHVVTVLLKVDPKDIHTPISLNFVWDPNAGPNGGADAVLTQVGNAHTITIYGLMEPASTSFVDRQKAKSD